MVATTVDRVAARAAELQPAELQPLKILLSVLAAPFYAIGLVIGFLWLVGAWAIAAVMVGVADARRARVPGS